MTPRVEDKLLGSLTLDKEVVCAAGWNSYVTAEAITSWLPTPFKNPFHHSALCVLGLLGLNCKGSGAAGFRPELPPRGPHRASCRPWLWAGVLERGCHASATPCRAAYSKVEAAQRRLKAASKLRQTLWHSEVGASSAVSGGRSQEGYALIGIKGGRAQVKKE